MHTEDGLRITNRTLSHLVDACVSNGYLDQAWDVAVGGGVTTHLDGLLNGHGPDCSEDGAGGNAASGDEHGAATVPVELYGPTLFRLVRALLADTQNQFRFEEAVEVVVVSPAERCGVAACFGVKRRFMTCPTEVGAPHYRPTIPPPHPCHQVHQRPRGDAKATADIYALLAKECVGAGKTDALGQVIKAAAEAGVHLQNTMTFSDNLDEHGVELWASREVAQRVAR